MNKPQYKHSYVAYLLRFFTELFFYLVTFAALLILLVPSSSQYSINSWPVSVAVSEQLPYVKNEQVILPIKLNENSSTTINRGEINFSSIDWPHYGTIGFLLSILNISLIVLVAHFVRRIFGSVEYGEPFTMANYHRLKYISILLLLMFFYKLIYSAVHHWYIINYVGLASGEFVSSLWSLIITFKDIQLADHQMLLHNQHSLILVYCAACVFVIALVFKEGLRLKRDSDSIV